jgi:hypothetical protein
VLPGDVQIDGRMRLVDGPYDGTRESCFILRGRLECEGGVYLHVLGGDPLCLYWVERPLIMEVRPAAQGFSRPSRNGGCASGRVRV